MALAHFTALADRIDRFNAAVGRAAAWGALFMVVTSFAVVLMRYVLGLGSIWLQESILYAHAVVFLLAAAWTLKVGGHVRIDVFYATAAPRTKAMIDLAGALFLLLPLATALLMLSLPYVARSWAILERSREASGLPLVFLLKSLIPAFALMLGLQGVAQAIRAALALVPPPKGEGGCERSEQTGGEALHVHEPHPASPGSRPGSATLPLRGRDRRD
jgi:TRAP-type mannitol/chloroaromatic compound transport system permease small subunit